MVKRSLLAAVVFLAALVPVPKAEACTPGSGLTICVGEQTACYMWIYCETYICDNGEWDFRGASFRLVKVC